MTSTLLELKKPLDESLVRLLLDLDRVLAGEGLPYLLAGAMARDVLLVHGFGCTPSSRRTLDVDFGVMLPDWPSFDRLQASLVASGSFHLDPQAEQRVAHVDPVTGARTQVDLVPFGAITGPDGTLSWPPKHEQAMRVLGYASAMAAAYRLPLGQGVEVPIASSAGLVLLKFAAWADRGLEREGRDAVDLRTLLICHEEVLQAELFTTYFEVLEEYAHEPPLTGAHVLGQEVAALAEPALRALIETHLGTERRVHLLTQMIRGESPLDRDAVFQEAERLLGAFERGLHSVGGTPRP